MGVIFLPGGWDFNKKPSGEGFGEGNDRGWQGSRGFGSDPHRDESVGVLFNPAIPGPRAEGSFEPALRRRNRALFLLGYKINLLN